MATVDGDFSNFRTADDTALIYMHETGSNFGKRVAQRGRRGAWAASYLRLPRSHYWSPRGQSDWGWAAVLRPLAPRWAGGAADSPTHRSSEQVGGRTLAQGTYRGDFAPPKLIFGGKTSRVEPYRTSRLLYSHIPIFPYSHIPIFPYSHIPNAHRYSNYWTCLQRYS
jgi:hypothetical protein